MLLRAPSSSDVREAISPHGPLEVGRQKAVIIPIFQMEKLRLREVKGLAKVTELGKGRDA